MALHLKGTIITLAVLLAFYVTPGAAVARAATPDGSAAAAAGNSASDSAEKTYTGERISLDFQNADIHNLIRIIGEVSGKTIVAPAAVSGKVTIKLRDIPWDQALDIILASKNLGVEENGNILTVYDLSTLQRIRSDRAEAEVSGLGDISALPMLVKKVFTPKYRPVGLVSAELSKLKSGRGKIVAVGNDIYVEDEPGAIAEMTKKFMHTDQLARQILIEARMVDSSAAFAGKMGFPELESHSSEVETPMSGEAAGLSGFSGDEQLKIVVLNEADLALLNAAVKAPEPSGEARTISAPRIMAANGQEVFIKQGYDLECGRRPCSSVTDPEAGLKKAVMALKLKPHIEDNNQMVSLEITLGNDDSNSAINNVAAKFTVRDGETVAIGGLYTEGDVESEDGFSAGRIRPLADWLDRGRLSGQPQNFELLIFLTAKIIPINL